ncbi:hypothetical protein GGD89_000712 [Roseospira visakhapatnamensis]|uniref:Sulfotransferase family protein n=2 Tax=Roseospira visakhapatnamensis TaxID=390880 RepID=A0A7W6W949_9PROT|nr:hypothetical protein [Roseospira visakhapatnamensis]
MLTFLGIGAQTCGTPWLDANLRRHPGLYMPEGPPDGPSDGPSDGPKDLHFWDRHRHRGLDWYRGHFAANTDGRPAGEITATYAGLEPAVIHAMHETLPDIRIVYLIRNPVRRAWSSARIALARAEMTLEDASDAWFIDHFHSRASSVQSDYEHCLRRWTGVYPRDHIHVELFDDVLADPRGVLKRCARHIGIDPRPFDDMPDETLADASTHGPGDSIRPSLHAHLVAHFTPRIRAFEDYLGRDLSVWHRQNGLLPATPRRGAKGAGRTATRPGLLAWFRRAVAANDPETPGGSPPRPDRDDS